MKPYIKPGWTVLDIGPGMGYFTISLAKLVGEKGKVIAADLQQPMLEGIRRRAVKAGVSDRIKLHKTEPDTIGIKEPVDFCLAFWMVHEVADRRRFLEEIAGILKPGGLFLVVEPKWHVPSESFAATIDICVDLGLRVVERPKVFVSRAALMKKP